MIHAPGKAALSALLLFLATFAASAQRSNTQAPSAPPEISYTVSMPKPYTHLLEVEMRVRGTLPAQTDLIMPVWTPGSYLVREFARNVQDFDAKDAGGRSLRWTKTNKNTWRVETAGSRELVVTYSVYANEFSVRTNEVTDQHAFWNNAALLMYPQGQLKAPSTLRVVPFGNWKVATALPAAAGGRPLTFRAENFDILYDSPVEVGNFKTLSFEVKGIPHRIVIDGEGNYDPERMRRDVQKIVEASVALMGGEIPYRDYTFFLHLRSTGGGGLEHLNSTALIFPRFRFRPEGGYRSFLSLVSHEYFHLWNVKRIRPDALGPFDYTQENYTRLLWVAEGITSYYENIILVRAGLITGEDYLNDLATAIRDLQNTPGRFEQSLEESSFDAWIKYYRPDENSVNSQVSYYDKGAIVGAMLDLEIRRASKDARSLDDVMRALYEEFYRKERNYTPEDFQGLAERMAGAKLDSFFTRYVRGREEIDFNSILNHAGLYLDTSGTSTGRAATERPYFGATLYMNDNRLMVRNVRAGTPAYDQGISAGDEIVALDGMRVNLESFDARLSEKKPGDRVTLTLFRNDDLRSFEIRLGGRAIAPYRIAPVPNPTEAQRQSYQKWLGGNL
ncbi:MAG TPA: PDZ domain-containing protein [Pyrinomonadaceae bacterium]|nr:PDZ domain-containing protein [Pyrinomonadaceae bacterium]